MVKLLQQEGYQVGSFAYPDDGPIAESGMLLADGLADWRMQYPAAKPVSIIAHSMGGLVARHYVEGVGYRGGVERLIMLGTPNHGSTWTGWRLGDRMELAVQGVPARRQLDLVEAH